MVLPLSLLQVLELSLPFSLLARSAFAANDLAGFNIKAHGTGFRYATTVSSNNTQVSTSDDLSVSKMEVADRIALIYGISVYGRYYARRIVNEDLATQLRGQTTEDEYEAIGFVESLALHPRMWLLADFLEIPGLQQYAREEFSTRLAASTSIRGGSYFDIIRAAY